MKNEVKHILIAYKFKIKTLDEASTEILSLMDENKNRLTGASADNKDEDNG